MRARRWIMPLAVGSLTTISISLAETPPPAPQEIPWRQTWGQLIPFLLIFAIIYFLILRPQQRKAKQHSKFLSELKKGDMVVTQSGIIGMVKNLSEKIITLEVDEGVCIKVLRGQIQESASTLKAAT